MENLLKEEQEKIFASLSQIIPGSSQETFFENEKVDEGDNPQNDSNKRLVPRKRKNRRCLNKRKRGKQKKKISSEENDSGFGTSTEILKYSTHDSDDSVTSVESVSLLESASSIPMKEASPGVKLAWNVKVFPAMDNDEEEMRKADKSVQTVHIDQSDVNIMRNVNFIGSLIRLKQILSSGLSLRRRNFERILRRMPEMEVESPGGSSGESDDEVEVAGLDGMCCISEKSYWRRREKMISGEEIRFVMRQSNADDVVEKSVDSILHWLRMETEKDWQIIYYCWDGSIHAEVVDILNEAVDSDVIGCRKKISDFLAGILSKIHNGRVEDRVIEFKVTFLSHFCKSFLLQYDLIIQIDKELEILILSGNEKDNSKKIYFILRLLENLFRSFLNGLEDGFKIFYEKPKDSEINILKMWKKNWMKKDELFIDEIANAKLKYVRITREWCHRMDQVVNFSLKECPVLSLIAQQCSSLVREIISKIAIE